MFGLRKLEYWWDYYDKICDDMLPTPVHECDKRTTSGFAVIHFAVASRGKRKQSYACSITWPTKTHFTYTLFDADVR